MSQSLPVYGERKRKAVLEVIIPVYRPGSRFQELLKRLYCQTLPPQKITLLVTGTPEAFQRIRKEVQSGEEERERAALLYRRQKPAMLPVIEFRRIEPSEFDHAKTRHLAASQSTADILVFMTEDAVPARRDLMTTLVRALSARSDRGEPAAAYARQVPFPDCGELERLSRRFNYPPQGRIKGKKDLPKLGIKTYFCSNVCAAYRREIYEKMGGFSGPLILNEDMIFAASLIQAGYSVVYEKDAKIHHSHNYSGWQQMRRNFDIGVSQAQHPEIFAKVSSESEGIRMVKTAAASLCRKGRFLTLGELVWQSGCKYIGYWLGKHYACLPRFAVRRLTMNERYWDHEEGV